MTVFSAAFSAVSVSAAQDVFELVAPSDSRVRLLEIDIGQYSDFGDAAEETDAADFGAARAARRAGPQPRQSGPRPSRPGHAPASPWCCQ